MDVSSYSILFIVLSEVYLFTWICIIALGFRCVRARRPAAVDLEEVICTDFISKRYKPSTMTIRTIPLTMYNSAIFSLRQQLGLRLRQRLGQRLGQRLRQRLGKRLGQRLRQRLVHRLGQRPGQRLGQRLGQQRLGQRLGQQLGERLGKRLGQQLVQRLGPRLGQQRLGQ